MKKRILVAVLAAVMVFSLVGCAGNKNESKDSKKESGKKSRDPGIYCGKSEYSHDRTCKRISERSPGCKNHL